MASAHAVLSVRQWATLTTRYMGIGFYVLGLISVFLNMRVFLQIQSRANSCYLFLLILNIIDLVQIHLGLLIRVVQHGFDSDPLVISSFVCKMRYYVVYVVSTLFASLITFAASERYGSTCRRKSCWRYLSKPKAVWRLVVACAFTCCIACLFTIPCYYIDGKTSCTVRSGACTILSTIYTLIMLGAVPPVFTALFAWRTLHNLRAIRYRSRSAPVSYKTYTRIKHINEELTSMLFIQVTMTCIGSLPYAGFILYQMGTHRVKKMPLQIAWEHFAGQIVLLLVYLNYICSAYINLTTSAMYRQRLFSMNAQFRIRLVVQLQAITSALLSLSRAERTITMGELPAKRQSITEEQRPRSTTNVYVSAKEGL